MCPPKKIAFHLNSTVCSFLANLKADARFVYLCCPQWGRFLQSLFERSFHCSGHFHNFGSKKKSTSCLFCFVFFVTSSLSNLTFTSPELLFNPTRAEQTHIPVDLVPAEPSRAWMGSSYVFSSSFLFFFFPSFPNSKWETGGAPLLSRRAREWQTNKNFTFSYCTSKKE